MNIETNREYYAGGLMMLIGIGAAYKGGAYGIGTMLSMKSGMFPFIVGVGLVVMGASIIASAYLDGDAVSNSEQETVTEMDWRGWFAIILGVICFMALSKYVGLMPAIFACVFISARGSKVTSWKQSLALASGVTIFGIALFSYALQVQIPILRGF